MLPKADEADAELVAVATALFHIPINSGSPHLLRLACFAYGRQLPRRRRYPLGRTHAAPTVQLSENLRAMAFVAD